MRYLSNRTSRGYCGCQFRAEHFWRWSDTGRWLRHRIFGIRVATKRGSGAHGLRRGNRHNRALGGFQVRRLGCNGGRRDGIRSAHTT
jgi:hypothetical protein